MVLLLLDFRLHFLLNITHSLRFIPDMVSFNTPLSAILIMIDYRRLESDNEEGATVGSRGGGAWTPGECHCVYPARIESVVVLIQQ